ncbi:putative defense protein Hdd11 [Trichoplusia ni]|uniref:Defense protein Hdd11 n=1 Tax=Trichoplusia ni TaxID=7111 RepID=A0A7E5WBL5_TRINI|nr:putative defense protein Hdd11 [Trichoplusia ni]XP_026738102.1 putative defense protein Hdd11 [Trichoplusia ni]XP_026738103.1 putative defense protein Hdd11 [Trichoplusia ni]XP_026738104.1 putative defense protein Hdd11 [Trichoplusia ni]
MFASVVILAVALVGGSHGYSSGAPTSVCGDMVPKHPVPAQSSPPPYTITTSTKVVKAGTPMEVVISGKTPKDTIRGLLLQARQGDKPVGTFTVAPNDPFAQLLNCGQPGNAVTHKKHDEKFDKQTVAFTWTPPAGFNDEIKFRATIALNGAVFWVGVESGPVKVTN